MTNLLPTNQLLHSGATDGVLVFFSRTIYGTTTVQDWLIALGAMVLSIFLLFLFKRIVHARLVRYAARTNTRIDDHIAGMLDRTKGFFLLGVGVYIGSLFLTLPEATYATLRKILAVVFLLQCAIWINRLIGLFMARYREKKIQEDNASARASISALGFISRLVLWLIFTLLLLDNLGFNISTLVAGIGISGIAVALAMQNILGDVFASFLIILDKPFVIGDFIIVDNFMGVVEYVGLKTTRIRSLGGEQLIFANSDLIKSRIKNYKQMQERRILFKFGVVYQTPADKVAAIPGMVREMIEAEPRTRFDRAHFRSFGDSSLDFEVVYFVLSPEYNVYADIQQAFNLHLLRRFAAEEIEFAYPTTTVILEQGS